MDNQIISLEQNVLGWEEKAKQIQVVDQKSYNYAAEALMLINDLEKEVKRYHEPIKTAAYSAHKVAVATEKKYLDPLQRSKAIIGKTIAIWEIAQRQIQEEKRRAAMELARKAEEESRLLRAIEAEKENKPEAEINQIIETIKPVKVEKVEPTFERMHGLGVRETWSAEVVDLKLLCAAAIAGEISLDCILPNMPVLNSFARDKKNEMNIPGVVAVKNTSITAR